MENHHDPIHQITSIDVFADRRTVFMLCKLNLSVYLNKICFFDYDPEHLTTDIQTRNR